ncbi:MAG: LysM peptidoglycan-binding domain-containing protein [Eubacteriales bacterium]
MSTLMMNRIDRNSYVTLKREENRINMRIARENKLKQMKINLLIIVTILTVVASGICFTLLTSAEESSTFSRDVKYASILITNEDTLWEIAQEYTTDSQVSIKQTVESIKKLNNLKSDTIYEGQYLLVAYR